MANDRSHEPRIPADRNKDDSTEPFPSASSAPHSSASRCIYHDKRSYHLKVPTMETQAPSSNTFEKVQVMKKSRGAPKAFLYRKSSKFQERGSKGEFRRKERTYNNSESTDHGRLAFLTGGKATQISMEDLSERDVVIAAMGPTGSGKSTFIFTATGVDTGIGHSLESCTREITMVKFSFPEVSNCSLVFVDMPGFDDTRFSGSEVQKMIQTWLKDASKKNIAISGLLYFHRISDNRMAGTPLKNLRTFHDLSKEHGFRNVVITTTMWDEVDDDLGVAREGELKSKYWEPILGYSTTKRFLKNSRQSAFLVLEGFIDTANIDFSHLLQKELTGMREHIGDNPVGLDLLSKVESSVKEQDEILKRLRIEMKTTMLLGGGILQSLLIQYRTITAELAVAVDELQNAVDVSIGKRLSSLIA